MTGCSGRPIAASPADGVAAVPGPVADGMGGLLATLIRTGCRLWSLSAPWVRAALLSAIFAFLAHGAEAMTAKEMRLLSAAVEQIRTHGLVAPQSNQRLLDDMLRAYLHSLDEYSDYLTAREYAAYLESTSADYFGVQMDLQKRNGTLLLFPFKGGLAEKSGIVAGDELIAVNGAPVHGKSVYAVGASIRGAEGETVLLTLRSGHSLPRSLSLRRQKTHYQTVSRVTVAAAHSIQIARFTDETEAQLRRILTDIGADNRPLLIDLRRNQGGSLISARQCADLFVAEGTVLFRLRDREGTRAIVAEQPSLTGRTLLLLQDSSTASAAEAFIASLTGNGRARSIGERSYGKGLAQRFLPLPDGSALMLTYAEILTPGSVSWHEQGLVPDIQLPPEHLKHDFFESTSVSALLELINIHQE